MPGYHAIMTEHNEERWRAIRKGIAPAYSMAAIRWVSGRVFKSISNNGSSRSGSAITQSCGLGIRAPARASQVHLTYV